MQIIHNTLIFYVQVPVTYISSFILKFFLNILYVWLFVSFSVFFQGKYWGFLHNRVATLVTIG